MGAHRLGQKLPLVKEDHLFLWSGGRGRKIANAGHWDLEEFLVLVGSIWGSFL